MFCYGSAGIGDDSSESGESSGSDSTSCSDDSSTTTSDSEETTLPAELKENKLVIEPASKDNKEMDIVSGDAEEKTAR